MMGMSEDIFAAFEKLSTEIKKVQHPLFKTGFGATPTPDFEPLRIGKVFEVGTKVEYAKDTTHEYIGDAKLGLCEKKIYSFLYENNGKEFSKVQVAVITGYSPNSGGFNSAISRLNSLGMIGRHNGMLSFGTLDETYILRGEKFSAHPDFWKDKLGACERKIYEMVWETPTESYSKEDIAQFTGYSPSSRGFNNSISHLNSIGLIRRNLGKIQLNPELLEI